MIRRFCRDFSGLPKSHRVDRVALFEPEETVGKFWHRLVGSACTYPCHPEAAVALDAVWARLGVIFRGLGGSGAIRITSGASMESGHRLKLKQRIGLGREKIERAVLTSNTLTLPAVIDIFPAQRDNEALYVWLAAWFAHAAAPSIPAEDPLQYDIQQLRAAVATTRLTLSRWPGLAPLFNRLRAAALKARPARRLPKCESTIEATIQALLGMLSGENPNLQVLYPQVLSAVCDRTADLCSFRAPPGYQTFLPVPIWGELLFETEGVQAEHADGQGPEATELDSKRRRAARRSSDQSQRGDPLLLHRFETIFSLAEMVNINRSVDDDDEEAARRAADDLPELTISAHQKHASIHLKIDLELAPAAAEAQPLVAEISYPEWDWKSQSYRLDYCRVFTARAPETGEAWTPDEDMQRRIRQVRRQFEALRPKRQTLHGEPDGDDLDLSALVRDLADRKAGGVGSERMFVKSRMAERDLSVAVLMDVSLSTDAWLQDQRVLDVEKGALLALSHGLTACGDEHGIFAFTSRRRNWISVATVKDFDERLEANVIRRIQGLKPGQYTRIGAAVRHVASRLENRPHRNRLLLILTDGKPNDIDHYEGRYGIEDTRMAIREAGTIGIRVFGVTVDKQARNYFPYIFGRGGYAIFPDIRSLPVALPAIYRRITG